jgi:biotin transport system substrate-specific component
MERAVSSVSAGRTRSLSFCGLSVALMAVSAWITVPLGPIPFTLQTFVMVFVLLAFEPKEVIASVLVYLLVGAVGLPVFSSMRGGFSALAGPTGGFLWGFLLGALAGTLFLQWAKRMFSSSDPMGKSVRGNHRALAVELVAAGFFILISYACGWMQLIVVAGMDPMAAFLAAIAPFVVVDAIKVVAAVFTADAVRRAIGGRKQFDRS